MSADSTSAISSAAARAAPMRPTQPPPQADQATATAASGSAPAVPQKPQVDFDPQEQRRQLEQAIDMLNEHMRTRSRALAFSVDDQLNRTVVTVKNRETGEVVRQIPDEALLRVAHHLEDVKGLLQDNQV